jgi:hypothetical protein
MGGKASTTKVNGIRVGDPNKSKTGKPNLHAKSTSDLQAMLGTVRPKMVSKVSNVLQRKAGRGR